MTYTSANWSFHYKDGRSLWPARTSSACGPNNECWSTDDSGWQPAIPFAAIFAPCAVSPNRVTCDDSWLSSAVISTGTVGSCHELFVYYKQRRSVCLTGDSTYLRRPSHEQQFSTNIQFRHGQNFVSVRANQFLSRSLQSFDLPSCRRANKTAELPKWRTTRSEEEEDAEYKIHSTYMCINISTR